MQDIGFFDVGGPTLDLVIENGDLKADDSLETAVLISLFTDRRVDVEELPEGETDPRGYWGDQISEPAEDEIGSLIWLLDRGKTDNKTLNRVQDSATDALQWLIDDGIAESVSVTVERVGTEQVRLIIQIFKPTGENPAFKFIWDAQELRRVAA